MVVEDCGDYKERISLFNDCVSIFVKIFHDMP